MNIPTEHKQRQVRILLVEDNQDHANLMKIMIKKADPRYELTIATSGMECLELLQKIYVDIIILDYELPLMSGLDILAEIKQRAIDVPVIIVTGKGDELVAVKAMKQGAYDYIIKDKGYMYVLPKVVQQALEKYALEKKLFESEKKYQSLFNSISDFISLQDKNFTITLANKKAAEMSNTPIDELIGKKCYEKYFHRQSPCENCPVQQTFNTKRPAYLEIDHEHETYNIRSHPLLGVNGELDHVIEIGQVVTEQRRLEKQLIQSEKLATIGLLSSGIAHELRNPLNIIETARYYIVDTFGNENPDLIDKLEIIKKNVIRASTIINNLLEFSRPSRENKEKIDINQLIDKTLSLIGKELVYKNIDLVKEYQKVPKVYFNLDSLKQVLLNIIINAIQAMPNGGNLTIKTEANDNEDVIVRVKDSGHGISRQNLPHIFSPFFTTKEVGVGTGLGLYISHSIMQRENGEIQVESEEGVGSTFSIILPTINKEHIENGQ